MAAITAKIKLDTFRSNNIPILKIPRGDSLGRTLNVVLTSLGEKITLAQHENVFLSATRPGDQSRTFSGVAADDGTASVSINPWILAVEGDVICSVTVAGSNYNYSTNEFIIEVGPSPYADAGGSVETESNSAIPVEVSSESEMTELLTSGEVGGVYKYTGVTGTYEKGALYILEESE